MLTYVCIYVCIYTYIYIHTQTRKIDMMALQLKHAKTSRRTLEKLHAEQLVKLRNDVRKEGEATLTEATRIHNLVCVRVCMCVCVCVCMCVCVYVRGNPLSLKQLGYRIWGYVHLYMH